MNSLCGVQNLENKDYKKLLEKTYDTGLQYIKKYVERIEEVFNKTSEVIMVHMIKSTKHIEDSHFCKNVLPYTLIDKMNFVNKLTELLNIKLHNDLDISAVSYKSLFSDKYVLENVT